MQFSTFQDLCREIEAVQHLTYDWTPLENDLKAGRTYVVFGITPLICAEVGQAIKKTGQVPDCEWRSIRPEGGVYDGQVEFASCKDLATVDSLLARAQRRRLKKAEAVFLVLPGYPEDVASLFPSNPDLPNRLGKKVTFEGFTPPDAPGPA